MASKMLELGFALNMRRSGIPLSWISPKFFKEFLDSRIKYHDEKVIEIDCNFLLHVHTRKCEVRRQEDINDTFIFWDDVETLKTIVNYESMNRFIAHPVISTYIDLKTCKYRSIFVWNFWLFVLTIILSFGLMIGLHFSSSLESSFSRFLYSTSKIMCLNGIAFLILRVTFKYYFLHHSSFQALNISNLDQTPTPSTSVIENLLIEGKEQAEVKLNKFDLIKYFLKVSNSLELALIAVSSCTLGAFCAESSDTIRESFIPTISVLMVLFTSVTFLTMLPFKSMPLHVMMLKKNVNTFLKFFSTFVFVLFAFSISFCLIFGKTQRSEASPLNNFNSIFDSSLKVIMMLSGEYSFEPFELTDAIQMIFFVLFVLTTYILFNLITGLTIDDVQGLRKNARYLTTAQNAEMYILLSEKFNEFWAKIT